MKNRLTKLVVSIGMIPVLWVVAGIVILVALLVAALSLILPVVALIAPELITLKINNKKV